ncbi:MAG: diguanylate cyclase [Elainellaceae cyanobacterium]
MPQSKHCKAIALPLRLLIMLPVLLQIVAIAVFAGYLMLRSGRQTIALMAGHLIEESSSRVTQQLDAYLQSAQQVNQDHVAALKAGVLDLQALDQLHRYLIFELQQHNDLTTLIFVTPGGDVRGVHRIEPGQIMSGFTELTTTDLPFEAAIATPQSPTELNLYSIDDVGNLTRPILTMKNFDVREKVWYRQAIDSRVSGWSTPFQIGRTDMLALNTYIPVYDDAQNLQGVFGVHLSLRQISDFLSRLKLGKTGAVFVVDSAGRLVADSVKEESYFTTAGPKNGQPDEANGQNVERLMATESSNILVSSTAQHLTAQFEHFSKIQTRQQFVAQIEGERHFVQVTPYRTFPSLDWLVVTVVPECSFTETIYSNLRRVSIAFAGAMLGAIAICFWVAQRVTRPIAALSQDAQALLCGDIIHSAHLTRIKEVDALQHSFYQMASRLSDLLSDLERQVQQRTAKLKRSEASLKEAQRIARIGSWVLNVATEEIDWSEELLWIYGLSRVKPVPSYSEFLAHLPSDDHNILKTATNRTIATGQSYEIEHRFRRSDGEVLYVASRGEAVFNEQAQVVEIVGTVADISDRKRLELELRILATVDELTQVANRRQLEASLEQEWQRHLRSQRPLTIIMIDIDHFKPFNDRYGHPAGDDGLRQVAQALKTAANRPGDLVARYGGEEFMLLLSDTDVSGAIAMANRIQATIAHLAIPHLDSRTGYLTLSMGILVVYVSGRLTADDAIAEADTALYCAKQARNTYYIQHIPCDRPIEADIGCESLER